MRCGNSWEVSDETSPLISRTILARGPGDQDLGFGEQQRAVAVGFALQALDFAAQPGLVPGRAQPRSHQQDGGDHRKAEQRQRRRERREFLMVHVTGEVQHTKGCSAA